MNETIEQRADRLVRQEVYVCLSSLVSTLAQGYGQATSDPLAELVNQAFELACPVDDYEEAAIQAGWTETNGEWRNKPSQFMSGQVYDDAKTMCREENIEPYQRDVFEHWAVSDWLADKLIERGEKVDKDFAGMCVWARSTTGQMISMDSCIEAIAKATMAPVDCSKPIAISEPEHAAHHRDA